MSPSQGTRPVPEIDQRVILRFPIPWVIADMDKEGSITTEKMLQG